ncbi:hypothetical protein MVEN_00302000 [Mycena venus]|uniref:Uncharacterized protein n=1 Tax=Mycena venus TaxID=2733690 RepID=A0A8H6YZ33_9AGAR|nr:hypothetical protein MVEN_00302000 [Mycena venus]
MARFAALFCAIVAAATSATASVGPIKPAITFFTGIDFTGQSFTSFAGVPTGCIALDPPFFKNVSSVEIPTGVKCTLWNETQCGLVSGNSVSLPSGGTPNLTVQGFNDQAVAYQCLSA